MKMKNKILAMIISAFSLPTFFALLLAVYKFPTVRFVFVMLVIFCAFISIYKISKLLLDEFSEKRKRA